MAATIEELFNSRRYIVDLQKPTAEFLYIVYGAADEAEAVTLVESTAPATFNGGYAKQIEITDRLMPDTFKLSVRYETNPEDTEIIYDTTGGTAHITQTIATVATIPSGAPDLQGAIGFDGENVNGIDIGIGKYSFSEKHYFDDGDLNWAAWGAMTYFVNSDSFRGYSAGEILFEGASGAKRGLFKWEITFKFLYSPNETGIVVGDIAGTVNKKGHEYLDIQYADTVDSFQRIKVPVAARVQQVYFTGAFSSLGL